MKPNRTRQESGRLVINENWREIRGRESSNVIVLTKIITERVRCVSCQPSSRWDSPTDPRTRLPFLTAHLTHTAQTTTRITDIDFT